MNKLLLFLFVVITSAIPLAGATLWPILPGQNDSTSIAPTREVNYLPDGVEVTYHFPNFTVVQDDLYPNAQLIKCAYFSQSYNPGEAAILWRSDRFAIPNEDIAVQMTDSLFVEMDFKLGPSRPLLSDDNFDSYSLKNTPPIKVENGWFPHSPLGQPKYKYFGHQPLLDIIVAPIQYDSSKEKLKVYKKISYRITWNKSASGLEIASENKVRDLRLKNICINGSHLLDNISKATQYNPPSIEIPYLIITTNKFKHAVQTFADWQYKKGYSPIICAKSSWNSHFEVLDSIRTIKNRLSSDIRYLLIVGGHEDIPGYPENSVGRIYYSDYMYSCPKNHNDISSMSYGRIPVETNEEADSVFLKIRNYEVNPCIDDKFYSKATFCAYFQDDNADGKEDRGYTRTCELAVDYLNEHYNLFSNRLYYSSLYHSVRPKYWNNLDYGNGGLIPIDLRMDTYNWQPKASDIISAIDKGSFLVIHRDHGDILGWYQPEFLTNHLPELSNAGKYPIMFSLNCSSGNYLYHSSFAENILKIGNKGCVGVIAASTSVWTRPTDILLNEIINSIWPDPGFTLEYKGLSPLDHISQPCYQMGDVLQQAKMRMETSYPNNTQARDLVKKFHYYGTPDMWIYPEKPVPLKYSIRRQSLYAIVSVDQETMISVTITGRFKRQHTIVLPAYTSAQIPLPTNGQGTITLSAPGYPVISYPLNPSGRPSVTKIEKIDVKGECVQITTSLSDEFSKGVLVLTNPTRSITKKVACQDGETVSVPISSEQNRSLWVISLFENGEQTDSKSIIF